MLFGGALLMEYYEPIRLYLAVGGVVLLAVAVWLKLTPRGCIEVGTPPGNVANQ